MGIFQRTAEYILYLVIGIICLPVIVFFALLIYLCDRRNPFYMATRVGQNGLEFKMIKLRSMIVGADQKGPVAIASNDRRLTLLGKFIRRTKIDELPQIINILKKDINLMGPRPQLPSEVASFTPKEKEILRIKPGIMDISSIVFADLDKLLASYQDPYLAYAHLVRPWKSRLAILYTRNKSFYLDGLIFLFTFANFIARKWTLRQLAKRVTKLPYCEIPYEIISRTQTLYEVPLP
jgi:lipopolysaccharide/colanic/teichoic acid biosynthesis glycosyltransferase